MTDLKWIIRESRFDYLSVEESKIYIGVRDSEDPKDVIIKRLLEKIASASRSAHCASRY